MTDLLPVIEPLAHKVMRAWIDRDRRALKALTDRKFVLLMGSKPCVMLDATSWLDAATTRWLCTAYRFGDIYVRDLGSIALFASQMEVQATIDEQDFSGRVWITDLWRKRRIGRGWRMVERVMSRTEPNGQVPAAIRSLQLWR